MLDLSGIVSDSIVDGPGIRTTVFSQGCPHHCPGCHNPETWDFGCGTEVPVEAIVDMVKSNPPVPGRHLLRRRTLRPGSRLCKAGRSSLWQDS